jgi:hypothetical protein
VQIGSNYYKFVEIMWRVAQSFVSADQLPSIQQLTGCQNESSYDLST